MYLLSMYNGGDGVKISMSSFFLRNCSIHRVCVKIDDEYYVHYSELVSFKTVVKVI